MKQLTALPLLLALLLFALGCTREVERVVVVTPTQLPVTATPQPAATATLAPTPPQSQPESQAAPTPLPDRASCAEIRGTEYRSPAERQWYLDNCVPTPAAAEAPASPLPSPPPPAPTEPPAPPPASVPSTCGGLPTYSQVVATYAPDVVVTVSDFAITGVAGDGGWWTSGTIEARGGKDLVKWYGVKITIQTPAPVTIDSITYQPGDKLTVDKNLNYVAVCSWD